MGTPTGLGAHFLWLVKTVPIGTHEFGGAGLLAMRSVGHMNLDAYPHRQQAGSCPSSVPALLPGEYGRHLWLIHMIQRSLYQ